MSGDRGIYLENGGPRWVGGVGGLGGGGGGSRGRCLEAQDVDKFIPPPPPPGAAFSLF